jgi:hypothetical protein
MCKRVSRVYMCIPCLLRNDSAAYLLKLYIRTAVSMAIIFDLNKRSTWNDDAELLILNAAHRRAAYKRGALSSQLINSGWNIFTFL